MQSARVQWGAVLLISLSQVVLGPAGGLAGRGRLTVERQVGSEGDLDDSVNFPDLLLLAQNYGAQASSVDAESLSATFAVGWRWPLRSCPSLRWRCW